MRTRSRLDLIAFLAILTMGTLMTALGVSASSLATIFLALSGLYGAWTGTRHKPEQPHDTDKATSKPPA
ncbi:hypothetical protein [Streptomyces sp. gb1(2016)]|uniref:Uncharacterized protein n=1 Tax=Streptomyces sp. gb1(2016) TaxID=1828321 RepID=A0A652L5L4_9ACTN|nr:hypothetical protein [Streptomyces sp. gb1(2016)]TXS31365.1 hypothetical protein EAO74_09445 [Streptomyces sp. gb1(2016)]